MEKEEEEILQRTHFTLLKYQRLARDKRNHREMTKDETVLEFFSSVLTSSHEDMLFSAFTTLEILVTNPKNIPPLRNAPGLIRRITEAVERFEPVSRDLSEKGRRVLEALNNPPEKVEKVKNTTHKKVLVMQVHGLHLETQKELEDILTKVVKGVLSVLVDVEHQRCTITVFEHVEPQVLATAISEHTSMEAKLVTKNTLNQEMLVSFRDTEPVPDLDDLPPYLEEKDSPVHDKAVRSTKDLRITASEWFSSAAGFLQKSFYW